MDNVIDFKQASTDLLVKKYARRYNIPLSKFSAFYDFSMSFEKDEQAILTFCEQYKALLNMRTW